MMNEKEKMCVKGVLEVMQEREVQALAKTVTKKSNVNETKEGK